ncbi:MAG TPA: hypothetical protein VLK22_02895 [Candidatus Udaeobacter sp.]|nr:hypothetical protein [Candidatus Udaeobacter sp.]
MSEVRSPLSADEIRRQAKFRDEAVRPPKDSKLPEVKPSEVKTFEVDEADLAEVEDTGDQGKEV